jgi:hypothetical protein
MDWDLTSPRTKLRSCGEGGSAEEAWCELAHVVALALDEMGICSFSLIIYTHSLNVVLMRRENLWAVSKH